MEKIEDHKQSKKRTSNEGSSLKGNDSKKCRTSDTGHKQLPSVSVITVTNGQNGTLGKEPLDHQANADKDAHSGDASVTSGIYSIGFINSEACNWSSLVGENLQCKYCMLMTGSQADKLLEWCEGHIQYNSKEMSKVRIMGKWMEIPRKQVAMGDEGLSYKFSGQTVSAKGWHPVVRQIRDRLIEETGFSFNFVLINRYKDGNDHIGEHQDDEKELVEGSPIASLSLGQGRDFVFKHKDSRGKNATRKIAPVVLNLQHGMLLLMNHPTNKYWYHSLPKRKNCSGVRVNMTFRVFHEQNKQVPMLF